MTSVQAVQGWLAEIQATMSNLPSALAAAAPTDGFAAVLSSAQALLDGSPGMSPGDVATTGTTGAPAPTTPSAPVGAADPGPPSGVPPAAGGPATGAAVVGEAERFLGVPYLWGGTTPAGFDCSGLVQYVYGQLGVSLPRTSEEQALAGTPVSSLADAQPGDLVFYAGGDGTPSLPGHVGIYLGNGQMIDAPYTGTSVRIDPVGTPVAIRRIVPPAGQAPSSPADTPAGPPTTPAALAPLFLSAAATYGLPASLLTAVAKVESGFSPTAVSAAGAEGLMQLMPATAASLGVDPFVPSQAIDGAARLLAGYLQQFGSVADALAAYNAGATAVQQHGGVPPFPQTQAYVQSVFQAMDATTSPSARSTAGSGS